MSAKGPRACVVGWPVSQSRSPLIHNYWLNKYGIAGSYERVAVPPEEIAGFFKSLAAKGFVGCNVTVPHKEAAFAALTKADAAATRLKAANTLWLDDGTLCGSNTDIHGFLANLDEQAPGWQETAAPALVLGAGGAARAVVAGLADRGVVPQRIVNRTREKAERLSRDLGIATEIFAWEDLPQALAGAGLVVNTTSLGMRGKEPLALDLSVLPSTAIVADIVYVPLRTALIEEAARRGLRTVDGLGMLLHQAVPGFARWFGRTPEVTVELRDLVAHDIEKG